MNKLRVLYVDDEPINLILMQNMLEDKFDIITSESGRDGLKRLSEDDKIKIVISDMKMPEMTGLEFIRLAKASYPNIIFYILTGFEITPEISESIEKGIIHRYFQKPFDIEDIESTIENILTNQRK